MSVAYLIRLDDARPRMDQGRWEAVERVLDDFDKRPLAAVIPFCSDPALDTGRMENPRFWEQVKAWEEKGWGIALHGHEHALRPSAGGLVPLNSYSEFVGLPEDAQREKIRRGYSLLREKGLDPAWWVAPAHGSDAATLSALTSETPIRLISDGLSFRPYSLRGFSWFPQQLWKPRLMRSGFWTVCLHPDEMSGDAIDRLAAFLSTAGDSVISPAQAAVLPLRPRSAFDVITCTALLAAKRLKRRIGR